MKLKRSILLVLKSFLYHKKVPSITNNYLVDRAIITSIVSFISKRTGKDFHSYMFNKSKTKKFDNVEHVIFGIGEKALDIIDSSEPAKNKLEKLCSMGVISFSQYKNFLNILRIK